MTPVQAGPLVVEEIGKSYRGKAVLDEVSFAPGRGEIFGLLGPNGSGKTTTLHLVVGLMRPTLGRILLDGTPIRDKSTRRLIGFAPDDLPMPLALTGREYLALHDRLRNRCDESRAAGLAEALGMSDDLGRLMSEYSHGMKRKVQLIAATMHQPRLLVLDEPFRGLDPEAASVLRDLLTFFTDRGGTVVVATHDMLRAERDCHSVLVLHRGRTVACGRPADLLREYGAPDIEAVFLAATDMLDRRDERRRLLADVMTSSGED